MKTPKLRFREFTSSWSLKKLGAACIFLDSKRVPLSAEERAKRQGQYPYYGASGIIDYVDDFIFDGEFVLLGEDGANILNRSTPLAFVINGKNWVNNHAHVMKAKGSNHFLAESLERLRYEKYNTGTAQPKLNADVCKKIKLLLPSEEEQQKIADFLSAVDEKIRLLKEKHALLQQYKKGVMQKLFSQEIRFKDDNGQAFPDWEEKTMTDVLTPTIREVPKPNDNYLALGIRSHMKGTFQKPDSDPSAIVMDKLYVVKPNDLVVNITFAWEGAIAIAKPEDDGGLVSHRFPTYICKAGESSHRYFEHIIKLKLFKHKLDLISPGGAGRNRVLSKSEFLKLKWLFPSFDEQLKIADFLDTLDKKLNAVQQQIDITQTFKKGLVQQMFV